MWVGNGGARLADEVGCAQKSVCVCVLWGATNLA